MKPLARRLRKEMTDKVALVVELEVLRFDNLQVLQETEVVMEVLFENIRKKLGL